MKFRVWHEKDNCFGTFPLFLYPLEEIKKQGCIIQWSTGFKDKNGIEIFEYDIVKFPECMSELDEDLYLMGTEKHVRWGNEVGEYPIAGFCFINANPGMLESGVMVDCMNAQYCEVIDHCFSDKVNI